MAKDKKPEEPQEQEPDNSADSGPIPGLVSRDEMIRQIREEYPAPVLTCWSIVVARNSPHLDQSLPGPLPG